LLSGTNKMKRAIGAFLAFCWGESQVRAASV